MGFKDANWAYTLDLPMMQKVVLVAVCHRTDDKTHETLVGHGTIAEMLGVNRSTVTAAVGVLKRSGILTCERRMEGGFRTSDRTIVNPAYVAHANVGESNVGESNVGLTSDPMSARPTAKRTTFSRSTSRSTSESARGARIPEPFMVTTDMRRWAATEAPAVDVDHATRMFVDHFRAATGRNATKKDWTAAWRNWLRRDNEKATHRPTPTARALQTMAAGQRVAGRLGNVTTLNPPKEIRS